MDEIAGELGSRDGTDDVASLKLAAQDWREDGRAEVPALKVLARVRREYGRAVREGWRGAIDWLHALLVRGMLFWSRKTQTNSNSI